MNCCQNKARSCRRVRRLDGVAGKLINLFFHYFVSGKGMFRIALALVVMILSAGASYARDWERLGERRVSFAGERETIEVGRHEGKFKRLKLLVRGTDIELKSISVVFTDGEVERLKFNERIRAGGESRPIDLRTEWHQGRYIREVELNYRSRPSKRGEAIAELWGQEQ